MKRVLNFKHTQTPILYLVATPIGNLDELSVRVINTLKDADIIACEDTRVTAKLLSFIDIKKPLLSCHEHNESTITELLITSLKEGKKVVYVSDAGYPGISDPGEILVRAALDADIRVSVISGPSAILNALVASGLSTDRFYFHGFLPTKETVRLDELKSLYKREETLIFYEAPHRIDKTLRSAFEVFGNRQACIARELTKIHEEYIRGPLQELVEIDPATLKGEMVLLVEGNRDEFSIKLSDEEIRSLVDSLTATGLSMKDAVRQVSLMTHVNKNYIYKLVHRN
jgi:16S rRNA (cytidine1402-2'-O)-methyltransferase